MGFAGVGFVLIEPAVVADLIPVERRGLALSVMAAGPVLVGLYSVIVEWCNMNCMLQGAVGAACYYGGSRLRSRGS